MKPDDIAIGIGGISAPFWLPVLNQWIALAVGILTITYLVIKIINSTRK
jgi:hypothetical protein